MSIVTNKKQNNPTQPPLSARGGSASGGRIGGGKIDRPPYIKGSKEGLPPRPKNWCRGMLPQTPGVYLFKDKRGEVIYVGKAGNLRRRVSSYWQKNHCDVRIQNLVSEVATFNYEKLPTVIEALIREAELIKKYQPKYNVLEKDDKSFLYVAFTCDKFPKPLLIRGNELTRKDTAVSFRVKRKNLKIVKKLGPRAYCLEPKYVFGPFVQASSIRIALRILRKIFPYSMCQPILSSRAPVSERSSVRGFTPRSDPKKIAASFRQGGTPRNDKPKPCFNYQIGLCPGVCVGAIARPDYMKNIRNLILFFRGKRQKILQNLKKDMKASAKNENFEQAAKLRNQIYALEHIRDTALISKETPTSILPGYRGYRLRAACRQLNEPRADGWKLKAVSCVSGGGGAGVINIFGRVEGYDISNISGAAAVGSMVVFQKGEPAKSEYRKFRIKTVHGANDVGMLKEVLRRRFTSFKLQVSSFKGMPDLILIDGGIGQVNAAREVLKEYHLDIPVMGIAKGFMRKQDRPVYDQANPELERLAQNYKDLLLAVRDEAHRFAVTYHRILRSRPLKVV